MRDAAVIADARRIGVWQALSNLFLDTENDIHCYRHIALVVLQSGYTHEEIHSILWHELYPVLSVNLGWLGLGVAGNWTGWTDEWLSQNIQPSPIKSRRRFGVNVGMIKAEWEQVARHLPPEYA